MKSLTNSDSCPECEADLRGDRIPVEYRDEHYGGSTHYSRVISIYDYGVDRVVAHQCPDCKHEEERV